MKRSLLYNYHNSGLENQSTLKPKKNRSMKMLVAGLTLTSLVDAFSILVIYLIVSTSSGVNVEDLAKGIELPTASFTELSDTGLLVQVTPRGIIINQEVVSLSDLGAYLQQKQAELKDAGDAKAGKLIVQADKESDFAELNPIVLAGTQSGFETIVFAALQVDEVQ